MEMIKISKLLLRRLLMNTVIARNYYGEVAGDIFESSVMESFQKDIADVEKLLEENK